MSTKERVRRPEPTRTQPIRNLSTLFGGTPRRDGADGAASASGRTGSLGEAVSRSVELGYRVVDEYIRQGQRTAQRLNERSLEPEAIARDVQDLTTRMTQYASDFLGVWFEFLELATAGGRVRRPGKEDGEEPPPAPAPRRPPERVSEPRARVRIALVSAQPAEVSVDLVPDAARRALLVHALRAVDPEKPRLADVVLEPEAPGQPLTLRIRVPAGQPPGVYNGLVIDEQTSRPAGTVSVRVGGGD